jgi:hypothetical protein
MPDINPMRKFHKILPPIWQTCVMASLNCLRPFPISLRSQPRL